MSVGGKYLVFVCVNILFFCCLEIQVNLSIEFLLPFPPSLSSDIGMDGWYVLLKILYDCWWKVWCSVIVCLSHLFSLEVVRSLILSLMYTYLITTHLSTDLFLICRVIRVYFQSKKTTLTTFIFSSWKKS